MIYRTRTKIIEKILEITKDGATIGKIMYRAYLSWSQVNNYVKYLQENELVVCDKGTLIYKSTEKGIEMFELLRKVDNMLSPTNEAILNTL